jgi:hypothetical protein
LPVSHGARIHTSRSSSVGLNATAASAYAATSRPALPILGAKATMPSDGSNAIC